MGWPSGRSGGREARDRRRHGADGDVDLGDGLGGQGRDGGGAGLVEGGVEGLQRAGAAGRDDEGVAAAVAGEVGGAEAGGGGPGVRQAGAAGAAHEAGGVADRGLGVEHEVDALTAHALERQGGAGRLGGGREALGLARGGGRVGDPRGQAGAGTSPVGGLGQPARRGRAVRSTRGRGCRPRGGRVRVPGRCRVCPASSTRTAATRSNPSTGGRVASSLADRRSAVTGTLRVRAPSGRVSSTPSGAVDGAAGRAEELPALELLGEREEPDVLVARREQDRGGARARAHPDGHRAGRAWGAAPLLVRGEDRVVEDEVGGVRGLEQLRAVGEHEPLVQGGLHGEAGGPGGGAVLGVGDDACGGAAGGRDDRGVEGEAGGQRRDGAAPGHAQEGVSRGEGGGGWRQGWGVGEDDGHGARTQELDGGDGGGLPSSALAVGSGALDGGGQGPPLAAREVVADGGEGGIGRHPGGQGEGEVGAVGGESGGMGRRGERRRVRRRRGGRRPPGAPRRRRPGSSPGAGDRAGPERRER